MTKINRNSEKIRFFILENLTQHPTDIAKLASEKFQLTRQAINKHIQKLIKEKKMTTSGLTRNKSYALSTLSEKMYQYKITASLKEDLIWRQDIFEALEDLPDNLIEIWHYGFTEMINNAIEHSNGKSIVVSIKKTAIETEIHIADDGIGIFKKIQNIFNLLDERNAVLELSKGKLTTDPKRHSGEGIFFTSRMFDHYSIASGEVYFAHRFNKHEDWILQNEKDSIGTTIFMKLNNHISRTVQQIFNEFTTGKDYGFNKTVVPVKLAQYGNDLLISRSQAKRLLSRIELFQNVTFDFLGVDSIGQAFADEIFRVFASQNPKIKLKVLHANENVMNMITRARSRLNETTRLS